MLGDNNKMGFGAEAMKKKKVNNQRTSAQTLRGWVLGDALICLQRAIKKLELSYEEISIMVNKGMFEQEVPFMHYRTAENVDIPYGAYRIIGLGRIVPNLTPDGEDDVVPELTLSAFFEGGADEGLFDKLMATTKDELATHTSLFKGHAIKVVEPKDLILPKYIDTTLPSKLILNPEVRERVENDCMFPITFPSKLREAGIRAQRGILLHGSYGVGKSLIAYDVAKRAIEAGRTFVLSNAEMLRAAVPISRFVQPSVLFVEDFEELGNMPGGLSLIRNMISGVESKKGHDVVNVYTTNYLGKVEMLDRSLLRPERIDSIIEVTAPTASTLQSLFTQECGEWMEEDDNWGEAFKVMSDVRTTPAVAIEMISRAKITAMREGRKVKVGDIEKQFILMQNQIKLSSPVPPELDTPSRQMAKAMYQVTRGNI